MATAKKAAPKAAAPRAAAPAVEDDIPEPVKRPSKKAAAPELTDADARVKSVVDEWASDDDA